MEEIQLLKQQLEEEKAARKTAEEALKESINHQKDASDALKQQKEFYESILNNLPADIAVFNTNFQYLFANPAAIKDKAVRDWIIGKTDYEYCRHRNLDTTIAETRSRKYNEVLQNKKPLQWEDKISNPDGNNIYQLRKLNPILDLEGNVKLLIDYGVNITEIKEVQEKLAKSEELHRLVIEATNDGIWDWDIEKNHVFSSDRLKDMLGYTNNDPAIKNDITDMETFMVPKDYVIAKQLLVDHLEKNVPFQYRLRFFHKNGSIRWIMCKGFALRDENGWAYRMLGSFTDITETVVAEEQIKESQEKLIEAKQAAEESTKAKEAFLANMSHEIRTPMNGIIGVTDLLSRTSLNEKQNHYLKLIKKSADNLLIIINDILDITKIASGKLTLEQTPFNVCDVVKSAVESLSYKAEEKGLQLIVHPPKTHQKVVIGDPLRLTQIFLNLINNAIKFTHHGSVEVFSVVKPVNDDEVFFEFTIKDTGIGIPKNKQKFLFSDFTQASSDIQRKYGGTGLGLSICKSLVEIQGGEIKVESTPGVGSTFIFSLTYKKGELKDTSAKEENLTLNNPGKLKILLAEDQDINQYLAKTLLEEWGFEVDIADNGVLAFDLFKEKNYDLILMDIQMPGMGGVEVTKEIRSYPDRTKSNIPIIALTANALVGDAEKYLAAGMNDYLSKPFDKEDLYSKIYYNTRRLLALPAKTIETVKVNSKGVFKEPLLNYSYFEKTFKKDPVFVKKVLQIFIDTTPPMLEELVTSVKQKDFKKINIAAHKLKSSVNSFKIANLQKVIKKIDYYSTQETNLNEISHLVQTTTEVLEKAIKDVEERIKSY